MITWIEKGHWLSDAIRNAGYNLHEPNGVKTTGNDVDDVAVQAIIDSFDPLPFAQAEAKEKIKEASAAKRLQYVTQAAGKDAEYIFKAQEATQFDLDGTIGVFMQGRITRTGEAAVIVAQEWNDSASIWKQVGALIAGIEDDCSMALAAETDWTRCRTISLTAVADLEAI